MNNAQCHAVKIHLCSSGNEQNVIVNSYHSTSTVSTGAREPFQLVALGSLCKPQQSTETEAPRTL